MVCKQNTYVKQKRTPRTNNFVDHCTYSAYSGVMSPAEQVIRKFGGIRPMASALGHRNPSTVQGWKMRGTIPSKRWPEIRDAGRRLGFIVPPLEFLEAAA